MTPLDPNDGGYGSRKLLFCLCCLLVIVGCWFSTGWLHTLSPTFDLLVGGVLAVAGLYLGANIGSKVAIVKSQANVSFQGELPVGGDVPPTPVKPKTPPKAKADEEEGS